MGSEDVSIRYAISLPDLMAFMNQWRVVYAMWLRPQLSNETVTVAKDRFDAEAMPFKPDAPAMATIAVLRQRLGTRAPRCWYSVGKGWKPLGSWEVVS